MLIQKIKATTTSTCVEPRPVDRTATYRDGNYVRSPTIAPARQKPARPQPTPAQLAEKVVSAFNTWAFKREQPSSHPALLQTVTDAIARGAPVSFVLYWGKGLRCFAGDPERQGLDFLTRLTERIRDVYAGGAAITLILTDTHAQLNGHSSTCIDQYFEQIGAWAQASGFAHCRLTRLVADNESRIGEIDDICPDTLSKLHACAAKWYRGDGTVEEGAREYYRMNMIEKRSVELSFPEAIFITYNSSEFRHLFPDNLPIFYMYSVKRGVAVKPWFIQAEVSACATPECVSKEVKDLDLHRHP